MDDSIKSKMKNRKRKHLQNPKTVKRIKKMLNRLEDEEAIKNVMKGKA